MRPAFQRHGRFVVLVVAAATVCLVAAVPGWTQTLDKAAPDLVAELDSGAGGGPQKIIVQYSGGNGATDIAQASGATLVEDYPSDNVAVMELSEEDYQHQLQNVLAHSKTTYVLPNRKLRSTGQPVSGLSTVVFEGGHVRATTGVTEIQSAKTLTGLEVGVAVIDSGIADHPDFEDAAGQSRIVHRVDLTDEPTSPGQRDPYGHGTHVAGLIAGNGAMSKYEADGPYTGVAPDVHLVDIRVLRSDGTGDLASLIKALDWIRTHRNTHRIRVVNISVGTAPHESHERDPLCESIRILTNGSIPVVVAAGNVGKDDEGNKIYGGILSPAICPSAITVGAANTLHTDFRSDDVVTSFSSRGPTRSHIGRDLDGNGTISDNEKDYDNLMKPDLVAPGNRLVSVQSPGATLPVEHPELAVGSNYMELSGTSMAAPVVTGIAALLPPGAAPESQCLGRFRASPGKSWLTSLTIGHKTRLMRPIRG